MRKYFLFLVCFSSEIFGCFVDPNFKPQIEIVYDGNMKETEKCLD